MYLPAQIDLLRRFFGAEYVNAEISGLTDAPFLGMAVRRLLKERKVELSHRKRTGRLGIHGGDKILTRAAITMPSDLREALVDARRHKRICGRHCAALTLSHSDPLRRSLPLTDDLRSMRVILDLRRHIPVDGRVMHETVDAGDHIRIHLWVPNSNLSQVSAEEDLDFSQYVDPQLAGRIMSEVECQN